MKKFVDPQMEIVEVHTSFLTATAYAEVPNIPSGDGDECSCPNDDSVFFGGNCRI